MRVAAIDLGSNSFLCLIAEKGADGQLHEIFDTIEFVKLGEGVHQNNAFSQKSLERAELAFQKFQKLIQEYKVEKVDSVATSASRDVTNKDAFFDLGKKYQIPINVISGESEGDYTYLGVQSARPNNKEFSVLDIGGGSTEIAFKIDGKVVAKSFNVGCVRLTELFLKSEPETETEIAEFKKYLNQMMPAIDHGGLEMVAVAGTPTTLASLYLKTDYNPQKIEGFKLQKKHVQDLIALFKTLTIAQRKQLKGIDAPRADVIMAGALILEHVMTIARLDHVVVSTRGVRYGLAYQMLGCKE